MKTKKEIKMLSLELTKRIMLHEITYKQAFNELFYEINKIKVPKTLNVKDKLISLRGKSIN